MKKSNTFSVYLQADLRDWFNGFIKDNDCSKSQLVRFLLRKFKGLLEENESVKKNLDEIIEQIKKS